MSKTEKVIERVYIVGGLVLLTMVIMSMSSCICGGQTENHCETVEERSNCNQGCLEDILTK